MERVFTFAAMATGMKLDQPSRVFGAATEVDTLEEFLGQKVEILEEGHISGLNGVLLGVAAEKGLEGSCFLGEMPHVFSQLPFPRASIAVLKVFSKLSHIPIDLTDLEAEAKSMQGRLETLMARIEEAIKSQRGEEEESPSFGRPLEAREEPASKKISSEDQQRIESLFDEARQDRAHAYRLKQELDRLEVFDQYEDRFLDLFHEPGANKDEREGEG